jgi:hypothetical protein
MEILDKESTLARLDRFQRHLRAEEPPLAGRVAASRRIETVRLWWWFRTGLV